MSSPVLFVSGRPRSGKTVVSRLLCDRYGFEYRNIGDLMAQRLAVQPPNRRQIGPRFLRQFGVDGYTDLLRQQARVGVLFDGLRLRAGLEAVADIAVPRLIFKDGPQEATLTKGLEYDIPWLRTAAAVVVPWTDDPACLSAMLTSSPNHFAWR